MKEGRKERRQAGRKEGRKYYIRVRIGIGIACSIDTILLLVMALLLFYFFYSVFLFFGCSTSTHQKQLSPSKTIVSLHTQAMIYVGVYFSDFCLMKTLFLLDYFQGLF